MTETRDPRMADWICQDMPRGREFVAFGCYALSDEAITDADILPCIVGAHSTEASQAWSANCFWYFRNTEAGIVLAQPGKSKAVICLKKSWKFIEAFMEAPIARKRHSRPPR